VSEQQFPPNPVLYIRSALFWVGFFFSTIILSVLSLFTIPFPFRTRYWFISLWTYFNLWWLEVTCKLSCHVEGLENITIKNGIVFSKHQSTWETLALKRWFNPESWVLKKELLAVPFFGWATKLMEPIALDRKAGKKAVDQLIDQGRDRLERGRWIMLFPEGTRIPPGKKGRYKIGGAALAVATGYPVMPVAHNSGEYWPRRGFIKKPGVIQVRIGAPIESKNKSAQEILQEAEEWIEGQMKEISTIQYT
jgi:1-acyl-sn-glycerol-3-phosphate acyltransferase